MWHELGKDHKDERVNFEIPKFLFSEWYMKNLRKVIAVVWSPCFGVKSMQCRKCKFGCLIALGDSESTGSGFENKSWCSGRVAGVAVWLGIGRRSESRTCWVAEARLSMSRLLMQQLTGVWSVLASTIVRAESSARGLVLCTGCPLHLAGCYVIVLMVLIRPAKLLKRTEEWK